MIPVGSYLILQGRCRDCNARIDLTTLLVESGTGIVFLLLYHRFGFSWEMVTQVAILCVMILMSLIDLKSLDVFDAHLRVIAILVVLLLFIKGGREILDSLPGFLIWVGFSYVVGDRMGDGDKWLVGILLWLLPWISQIWWLLYSIWTAATVAIVMLIRGTSRKTAIPFIPFLTVGYFLVLYFPMGWWG